MHALWADAAADTVSVGTVLITVLAIVGGLVVAGGSVLLGWLNNGGRLVKRVDELTTQVFSVQGALLKCKEDHAGSLLREGDLKHDLAATQRRVEVLESAGGVTPAAPVPGVLVADLAGVIRVFSPSLTVFLGWLPAEMEGQSVERLVPPELLEAFRAGFGAAARPGYVNDPARKVNTYALDKNGRRVPVSISPRKWPGAEGLITATFTVRPSAGAAEARQTGS